MDAVTKNTNAPLANVNGVHAVNAQMDAAKKNTNAFLASMDSVHLASILSVTLGDIARAGKDLCLDQDPSARVAVIVLETCSCVDSSTVPRFHKEEKDAQHQGRLSLQVGKCDKTTGAVGQTESVEYSRFLPLLFDVYAMDYERQLSSPVKAHRVWDLLCLPFAMLHLLQYGDEPVGDSWSVRDFDAGKFSAWWQTRTAKQSKLLSEKLALWLLQRSVADLSAEARRTQSMVTARDLQLCDNCNRMNKRGSVDPPFKLCGGCQTFVFCSAACQKAAWPRHAPTCKFVRLTFSRAEIQLIKQLFTALNGEQQALSDTIQARMRDLTSKWSRQQKRRAFTLRIRFASLQALRTTVAVAQSAKPDAKELDFECDMSVDSTRVATRHGIRAGRDTAVKICLCYALDASLDSKARTDEKRERLWPLTIVFHNHMGSESGGSKQPAIVKSI